MGKARVPRVQLSTAQLRRLRPHKVRLRRIHWLALSLIPIAVLALIVVPFPSSGGGAAGGELAAPGQCPGDQAADAPAADQARTMRCLINHARQVHHLSVLSAVPALARSAARKDALMLSCDQFRHDACGLPWANVYRSESSLSLGENLAWASQTLATPRQVMAMWLGSPEHRTNILHPAWREQGVSVSVGVGFQGQSDVNVWTSSFTGAASAAAASVEPAPVPPG
jgi:uncharacterized protein YkwD